MARSRPDRAKGIRPDAGRTEADGIGGGPARPRRIVRPYGPGPASPGETGDPGLFGRVPPLSWGAAHEYQVGHHEQGRSDQWPNWQSSAAQFRGMRFSGHVIRGWWEYQRLQRGTPEERRALQAGHPAHVCASWAEVRARIAAGGMPALELVVAILGASRSDEDVSLVGAGPLEDLVHKHGDTLVDAIEDLAARDGRFAHALSRVWLAKGVLRPSTELRLSKWITVTGKGLLR